MNCHRWGKHGSSVEFPDSLHSFPSCFLNFFFSFTSFSGPSFYSFTVSGFRFSSTSFSDHDRRRFRIRQKFCSQFGPSFGVVPVSQRSRFCETEFRLFSVRRHQSVIVSYGRVAHVCFLQVGLLKMCPRIFLCPTDELAFVSGLLDVSLSLHRTTWCGTQVTF